MSVTRRTKRPKHAKRRLDLSAIKEALKDERAFPCLGVVTDEGVDSHFSLDGEDLLIEVELVPGEEQVTARMGFGAGSSAGIWFVPPVGTEVALIICDGDVEAGVFIVGVLSSGAVPSDIASGVTVIAAPSKVLIHDGAGGAAPLPTLAEFTNHTHTSGMGPTGPVIDPIPGVGPITGTTVLEAK